MLNSKNIPFVLCVFSISCVAMQESEMIQVHQAEDLVHFAGQVVAYTPVNFIEDSYAYKEESGQILNPALRYGYVTPGMAVDWRFWGQTRPVEQGHVLIFLQTKYGRGNVAVLLTRWLKENKLLIRKATSPEIAYLLQILKEKKAYFQIECGCEKKHGSLEQILAKS